MSMSREFGIRNSEFGISTHPPQYPTVFALRVGGTAYGGRAIFDTVRSSLLQVGRISWADNVMGGVV